MATRKYRKPEDLYLPNEDISIHSPFYNNVWDIIMESPFLIIWHVFAFFTIFPLRVISQVLIMTPLVVIASVLGWRFEINPETTQRDNKSWLSKFFIWVTMKLYRLYLFFGYGLIWVSVKGKIRHDVKITVAGPHSSLLFDALAVFNERNSSLVASAHLIKTPIIGTLSKLIEPVYVDRADPKNRKKAISMMKNRIENWEGGLFIFPEGCITNGTCLANYRVGAFIFDEPIQPVIIKVNPGFSCYFKVNPGNWGWVGPHGDLICNVLSMCQPWTTFSIEYLEPYTPTKEDLDNRELYALNVQKYMAEKSGTYPSDYISYDGHCIEKSVWINNYAHKAGLIGVEKIKRITGTASHFIAHEIYNEFMKISNYQYDRKPNHFLPTNYVGETDHITSSQKAFKRNFREPSLTFESILKYFDVGNFADKIWDDNFNKFKSRFPDPQNIKSVEFCTAFAHEYHEFMTGLNVTEISDSVPELTSSHDELLKNNLIYNLVRRNSVIDMKVIKSPFHVYKTPDHDETKVSLV